MENPDLLGIRSSELSTLFSGDNAFKDLKVLYSMELAWFPHYMLDFSEGVNICTILILLISSDEGACARLSNWKSIVAGVPSWVASVTKNCIRANFVVESRRYLPCICPLVADNLQQVTHDILKYKEHHNVSLAISLMMVLHPEYVTTVKRIVDLLGKYFCTCFDNDEPPVYARWENIAYCLFTIKRKTP